jgi:hypothetical protein
MKRRRDQQHHHHNHNREARHSRHPQRRRLRAVRAAAAAAAVSPIVIWPLASRAATDSYILATGVGSWSTAANWSLGHQPGNLDDAVLTTSNFLGVTVTYDALATATNLTIDSPSHRFVGLSQSLNTLNTGFEHVGATGTGNLSISGGTHAVTAAYGNDGLDFGYGPGSSGNGNLSGSGVLAVTSTEVVGNSGSGTFTQSGGTNTAQDLILGNQVGGSGTYTLMGGTLHAFGNEFVGHTGPGIFNQSGGINQTTFLYVSNATYNQSGGSNFASELYFFVNTAAYSTYAP